MVFWEVSGDLFLGSIAAFAGAPDAAGTGIPHATRLDPTTTFLWGSAFWYSLSPFANLLQSFGNRKTAVRKILINKTVPKDTTGFVVT